MDLKVIPEGKLEPIGGPEVGGPRLPDIDGWCPIGCGMDRDGNPKLIGSGC